MNLQIPQLEIPFETDRLLIREANPDDSLFILKLLNSPSWLEFIGDKGVKNEKDAQNYIENSLINSYLNNGFGLYHISLKENSEPIGLCGYLKRDYLDYPDLGFALLPDYEGHGYMWEASTAMLQFGKSTLKLDRVLAIVMPLNLRSQKLLRKIGFVETGPIRPNSKEPELLLFSNKKNHSV